MANLNRIMMNFEFEKAVKYSKSRGGGSEITVVNSRGIIGLQLAIPCGFVEYKATDH